MVDCDSQVAISFIGNPSLMLNKVSCIARKINTSSLKIGTRLSIILSEEEITLPTNPIGCWIRELAFILGLPFLDILLTYLDDFSGAPVPYPIC